MKEIESKGAFRIGVTSPLIGDQQPTDDMGAVQHSTMLERFGVKAIILRNDMSPLELISEFNLRGIVFSGGGDIAPGSYGGDTSLPTDGIDFRRDVFEFALMECAFELRIPVLAICRGMQVANVVLNGTLIEDLSSRMGPAYTLMHHQVNEAALPYHTYAHEVTIERGTLLHDIVGLGRLHVNSIHHQAIDELGTGLRVAARADDDVIEAIEFTDDRKSFFIGVQWHPEWLSDDPVSRTLYARLMQACNVPLESSMCR